MPPAAADDLSAEGMQCTDHPYRKNPGGICAFCLQEKLGKLVSSSATNSTPLFIIPHPSSSSSSPSFRSDYGGSTTSRIASNPSAPGGLRRSKLSFLSATNTAHKKKYNTTSNNAGKVNALSSSTASSSSGPGSLKRSKSVAPRPTDDAITTTTPRNRSFWSFLYHSSSNGVSNSKRRSTSTKDLKCEKQNHKIDNQVTAVPESPGTGIGTGTGSQGSGSSSSFGRKVARSRSVGCGSRSFSGDFLDRISTGFGDCTLRRVESHREGSNQNQNSRVIKDRVNKCGGIFGGFGMISTSSSYWLSAAAAEEDEFDGKISGSNTARASTASIVRGGKHRSWGWAFASPMRAFKPSTTSNNVFSNGNDGKLVNGGANGKVGVNLSPLAVGVK